MKSLRDKQKNLDKIYGAKLNNSLRPTTASTLTGSHLRGRPEESLKIEHKSEKPGLLVSLKTPNSKQQTLYTFPAVDSQENLTATTGHHVGFKNNHVGGGGSYATNKPGSQTYRINTKGQTGLSNGHDQRHHSVASKNPNHNKAQVGLMGPPTNINGNSNKNSGVGTNTNVVTNYLNLNDYAAQQLLQNLQPPYDTKSKRSRSSKSRSARNRRANLEKLFQQLNMESIQEEQHHEPPAIAKQTCQNCKTTMTAQIGDQNLSGRGFNPQGQGQCPSNGMRQDCRLEAHEQMKQKYLESGMDAETAEFVTYVRLAVEDGVTNAVRTALDCNYKIIEKQMECFTAEMQKMNYEMRSVEEELLKKIVYYGEESLRQFRYLCMKTEYDKMFMQQNLLLSLGNVKPQQCVENKLINHSHSGGDVGPYDPSVYQSSNDINQSGFFNSEAGLSLYAMPKSPLIPTLEPKNQFNPALFNQNIDEGLHLTLGTNTTTTTMTTSNSLNTSVDERGDTRPESELVSSSNTNSPAVNNLPLPGPSKAEASSTNRLENFCKKWSETDDRLKLCKMPPQGTLYNSEELMIINKEMDGDEIYSCESADLIGKESSTEHLAMYESQIASHTCDYIQVGNKLPD